MVEGFSETTGRWNVRLVGGSEGLAVRPEAIALDDHDHDVSVDFNGLLDVSSP